MIRFIDGDIDTGHQRGKVLFYQNNCNLWLITQHLDDFDYDLDGTQHEGSAGELIIVTPGHKLLHGPKKNAIYGFVDDWIMFEGDGLAELAESIRLPLNIGFDISNGKFIDPYIRRVQKERSTLQLGWEHCVSIIITEMLVEMGRRYEEVLNICSPQKLVIDRVRREMLLNCGKNWSIKQLADMAGYSESHFSSLYQKFYAVSPIDDLLKCRITLAKKELARHNLSVTEISQKCGFSSIHHFSRFFKKTVGISPSEYTKIL